MVRCTLHLYLPAGWELGEGAHVEAEAVRALGDAVRARCDAAATALAALASRGWRSRVGRHELVVEKDCDRATAMLDFLQADLDPVALGLEESVNRAAAGA